MTQRADPPIDDRGLPAGYRFKPEVEITPADLSRRIRDQGIVERAEDDGLLLLDCRTEEEHRTAHISGAILIPLIELQARTDELESENLGQNRPIVVMCHHGVRSMRVVSTLRSLGFSDVRSVAGGIDLWSRTIDPSVPRY